MSVAAGSGGERGGAPARPKVFVVDDDRSFLNAVARLLRASGHDVETFSKGADLLARLERDDATGCVLADLRMPGMDGLSLQQCLAGSENPLPVVFLTGHGDISTTVRAMKAGAEDFLIKTAPKPDLLAAVTRALARSARERGERGVSRGRRERFDRLTPREHQVLAQIVQGRLNKEIAWTLGIHERTVKLHRTSLFRKLGVGSAVALTRLVEEAGLVPELDAAARAFPKGQ
ncbi:MAG TPA: response regulator [Candidatus Polarisedimenticolia bacterium]|nr:response regulator [Candidatus Polarisedimenticolia bacterium]